MDVRIKKILGEREEEMGEGEGEIDGRRRKRRG